MPEEKRFIISRRTLLGGAAALSGYALLGGHTTAAVAQTPPATSSWFREGEFDIVRASSYSKDWSQRITTAFPARIPLSRPAHAGSLQLDWDTRLFDAPTRAYSIVEGVTVDAAITKLSDGVVSVSVPQGAADIVVLVRGRNPYPEENIGPVQPSVLRYVNAGGKTLEELRLDAVAVPASAWGVEAEVSWVSHGGSIVPDTVTLVSAGPGPIPKGIVANLTFPDVIGVEPEILGLEHPNEPPFAFRSSSAQGIHQLAIETVATVGAGVRTDFVFPVEGSDSLPGEWPQVVPRLVIAIPEDSVGARATNKLSVFPVTSSGSQLSTYLGATRALELATREGEGR